MTMWQAFLQLSLTTLLLMVALAHVAVALLPHDASHAERRRTLLRAWFAPLPVFALWLALIGGEHGWRLAPVAGFVVWLAGWVLLHPLASHGARAAHGLLPAWFLSGAGIAVDPETAFRSQTQDFIKKQTSV